VRALIWLSIFPLSVTALAAPSTTDRFPDATTTGAPSGMTLTRSDGLVIDTPGTVVDKLDIQGSVVIGAKNVTLRNCKVTAQSDVVVLISPGITGAVVQNCEINNQGSGGVGIAGQGLFVGNNIHDCADGIDVRGDNTTIEGNYIHNMNGPSDSHYDGIQADGGFSNLQILRNTVINQKDQTSAIMLSNYWGPVTNVMIDGNLLIGGGYTVYISEIGHGQAKGGPLVNVTFTNNRLARGVWGPLDLRTELGATPMIAGNTIVPRDYLQTHMKGAAPFSPRAAPHSEKRRSLEK
jgi:hypothetical protein